MTREQVETELNTTRFLLYHARDAQYYTKSENKFLKEEEERLQNELYLFEDYVNEDEDEE